MDRQQPINAHLLEQGLRRSGGQASPKRLLIRSAPLDHILCLVGGCGRAHEESGSRRHAQGGCRAHLYRAVRNAHARLVEEGGHILPEQFPVRVLLDLLGDRPPDGAHKVCGVHVVDVHGYIGLQV